MNEIGKWVEELMAAGCMPKVAAKVVTEIFAHGFNAGIQSAPKDETAERRREWDRERKRAQARKRNSAESGGNRVEIEPTQWLWRDGQGLLRQLGVSEKQARNNIGIWLKAGNDPGTIKELVVDAHQRGNGNPIPYITAGLGKRKANGHGGRSMAAAADDLIARAEERERETHSGADDIPF